MPTELERTILSDRRLRARFRGQNWSVQLARRQALTNHAIAAPEQPDRAYLQQHRRPRSNRTPKHSNHPGTTPIIT
ncbi:MAG: hypothetical protein ACJ8ES_11370 [Xanthobacteraceae bacterium]